MWFLSARPGQGATFRAVALRTRTIVSIRTPRAGRDPGRVVQVDLPTLFLSARPGQGATIAKRRQ